jgi:hypothetical protein
MRHLAAVGRREARSGTTTKGRDELKTNNDLVPKQEPRATVRRWRSCSSGVGRVEHRTDRPEWPQALLRPTASNSAASASCQATSARRP